jgi:hypothetical protein
MKNSQFSATLNILTDNEKLMSLSWLKTYLPALKGNNSCKAYNFRIKVGHVQMKYSVRHRIA